MLGAFYDLAKFAVLKLLVLIDAIRRWAKPANARIIKSGTGTQAEGKHTILCLFAHFDRDGLIDDYVVQYLQALDDLGCETVFVSTADGLVDGEVEKIRPYCVRYIVRQNSGYDFASWRTGLETVGDISRFERLIVANDSVYGPLQDLRAVFDEMVNRNTAFWGITDSLRYGRHLQSYFVVFERPVLQSTIFRDFWRKLPDYRHKHVVIIQCEVGLSRALAAAGFNFAAYCPFDAIRDSLRKGAGGLGARLRGTRVSPTHKAWRALMRAGCPFLKVQLLRDNPLNVPDIADWAAVLGELADYDLNLIARHLARMKN